MSDPRKKKQDRSQEMVVSQPWSKEAEEAMVGAFIFDLDAALNAVAGRLSTEDFFDPFCRLAIEKCIEIEKQGGAVDPVLLAARMDGYLNLDTKSISTRLLEIANTYPTAANVEDWSALIRERSSERKLAKAGESLQSLAHAQDLSVDQKIARMNQLTAEVSADMVKSDIMTCEEVVMATLHDVERRATAGKQITGVPTGITELDKMTCGLQGGELIIVAARPSMGKTSLALTIAKNISANIDPDQRGATSIFSLEMGAEQLGMRWVSLNTGVPIQRLKSGTLSSRDWEALQSHRLEAGSLPIHVDVASKQTLDSLQAKIRRAKREHDIKLAVIDYLGLIDDGDLSGRHENRTTRVGAITAGLKQLAKDLGIPIMLLAQLNRSLEARMDKRPIMSDLRESGSIEQDADMILFIYRDEVYHKESTVEPGVAELIIAKQRNGPTGTVKTGFDAPTTMFTNEMPIMGGMRGQYRDPLGEVDE